MSYPRIAEKIILALAMLAIVTLLLVWYATLYPFVFPKVWLFRVLVEGMAVLYIPLWFSYPEYRPKKSFVWVGVGIYLAALTVSALLGASFYKSFLSNTERMEGLFGMLHYAAYTYMLAGVARKDVYVFSALYKVVLGVGVVSIIAAVFKVADSGYIRLEGVAGNPSFFASQLLLSLVIALLLAVRTTSAWRTLSLAAGLMFLVALFATGTRGAFLGVAVGSVVSLAGIGLNYKRLGGFLTPRRITGAAAALVILLGLGGWWIMRHRTLSLQDANIRSRITAMRISIAAWREYPVLGWGPENYNIAFNKYIDPKVIQEFSQRQWFDRAHNKLLDVLVMGGVVGLAAYLFFLGTLLWAFRRLKKQDGGIWIAFIGIGGLIAYVVHNLFVFDVYQSYLLLFLLVGYLASQASDHGPYLNKISQDSRFSLPLSTSVLLAVLVVAPTLWFGSVHPLKASLSVGNALGLDPLVNKQARTDISDDLRFRAIVGEYQKAISYNSYVTWEALLLLERFYVGELRAGNASYDENLLAYLEARLNDAAMREPQKYEAYLALGEVLNTRASYEKSHGQEESSKEIYGRASAALVKAVELAPNVPRVWYAKGTLHIGLNQNQEGIVAFRKAVELNPDIAESQWTLASAYLFLGQYKEAADTFDEAQRRGYKPFKVYEYKQLFEVYVETVQYEKVERALLKLIELEPKNAKWHAVLAATYKGMGRYAEAREEVKRAVELDGAFAREAEVFLKTLPR